MSNELVTINIPDALKLAHTLMDARNMLPNAVQNAGQALAIIMSGAELGLPPMTSLREVVIIEGKVTLSAQLMLALLNRAGIVHNWDESTTERATITLQRGERKPFALTFTIEDAKRADLVKMTRKDKPNNWMKYPAAMLRARAVSAAARAYCPDVLMGVYVHGELTPDKPTPEGGSYEPPDEQPQAQDAPEPVDVTPYRWSDEDRVWFCASLSDGGYKYKDVARYCESRGTPRPSALHRPTLERMLSKLQTDPDARHDLDEFLGRLEIEEADKAEAGDPMPGQGDEDGTLF